MNKNNIRKRLAVYSITAFACFAAMLSIRCKDNCVGQPPMLPAQTAFVRFVHASPDSPPVDMTVDSTVIVTGLAFNSFPVTTTGYHAVRATANGSLSTRFTGTTANIVSNTVTFAAGEHYTVVLINKRNALRFLVLHDTLTPPTTDSSRVRFIHAVPIFSIDISLGGKSVVKGLAFGNSSGYVTLHSFIPPSLGGHDTGSFDVNDGNPPHTLVFDLPSGRVVLVGQSVFTIIVLGEADPNDRQPLPTVAILYDDVHGDIIEDPSYGAVRLMNLIQPSLLCNLQIYNAVSSGGLPPDWRGDFPDQNRVFNIGKDSASTYLLLGASTPPFKQDQSGNYWMGIRVTNVADGTILTDSTAINPYLNNERYTVAVVGTGSAPYPIVILQDTLPDPPDGMSTIRFFNASPDPSVTASLAIQGGNTLYNGITYKQVTGITYVAAGNTTFKLNSSGSASATLATNLIAGQAYTVVATGLAQDNSYALHIYVK